MALLSHGAIVAPRFPKAIVLYAPVLQDPCLLIHLLEELTTSVVYVIQHQ
jgi:hypothetical protein